MTETLSVKLRADTLQAERALGKIRSMLKDVRKNIGASSTAAEKSVRTVKGKLKGGIGLHEKDEVNLLPSRAKGGRGGSSGGRAAVKADLKNDKKLQSNMKAAGNILTKSLLSPFETLDLTETIRKVFSGSALEKLKTSGSGMASALASGITGGVSAVAQAARKLASKADFSSGVSQARSAGANLGGGFAEGILSKLETVRSNAAKLAGAAVSKIKSALNIHSPSRVTERLGEYFTRGFAEGVEARIREAESAAERTALRSAGALAAAESGRRDSIRVRTGEGAAARSVDLTVPLYVDAVKLGQASVKGINQLTRQTGRVQLEL